MARRIRKKECLRCKGSFLTYEDQKFYCNDDCRVKHLYECSRGIQKEFEARYCKNCGTAICMGASQKRRDYCDKMCQKLVAKTKGYEERIPISNARIKKKTKPKTSLSNLIWKQEYDRLYDEFHINRIIRGKS